MDHSSRSRSEMELRVWEATPGTTVLLSPDSPLFPIVTVSNDFIELTRVSREEIAGKGYLHFLESRSGDENNNGIENLRRSLELVLAARKPHEVPVQRFNLPDSGGEGGQKYWRLQNTPVLNPSGEVLYIIHTIVDITDRLKAERNMESFRGMEKAYKFFMNAPVIIGYVRGDNYTIELANEGLLKVWRRTRDVIGKPLLEAIPELEQQGIKYLLDEVRLTGKPFFAYEHPLTFSRGDKIETLYFDFVYQPFYENESDTIASGVISVGHDVTEQVEVRHKFKNVIDQAQDPILIFKGRDMVLEVANEALYKLWQIDNTSLGKPFLQILPEMREQGFLDILQRVYDTGEPFQGYEIPAVFVGKDGVSRTHFFNFTYQPYRGPDGAISGVLVLASDATLQVHARRELEESERKWKDLANSMPAIVWIASPDGSATFFNDQWYQFTGLTKARSMGFEWTSVLHPHDAERCLNVWREAIAEETFFEIEVRYKKQNSEYRWIITRGVPVKQDGKLVAWYGTGTDIHERKQLQSQLELMVLERTKELEDKNKLLDNILLNSSNGISVSEMIFDEAGNVVDAVTILANDAAVKLSGLPRNQYVSQRASKLDPHIMKSPYGQKCIQTLKTGEPFVMQYFLEVTSRWLELTVSKMDDGHLIHIFTDVTPIKQAQLQLEKSLEDLRFANANLEEFAYAASHDLKEPVRKVQYFSNRLKEDLVEKLNTQQIRYFERLENSSARMMNLIDDLLEYSQAAKGTSEFQEIDLNKTVANVLEDLELEIEQKKAIVAVAILPVMKGNSRQMHQLFQNLVSNALKYSKPHEPPRIDIASRFVNGNDVHSDLPPDLHNRNLFCIEVKDNGIGFEEKYADSIFKVFSRLHSDVEYRGSGIGLSIVKKVVESHHGFILAKSTPRKGSTFTIWLPAD